MIKALALLATLTLAANASEVFGKPADPIGGLNRSSWVFPDGTDSDEYAWDEFTLTETQTITEVHWRGGYVLGAPYGHATDFRVSFFDSNVSGFEPYITAFPSHESQETPIATFHTNGIAGESYAGFIGGHLMYNYTFKLPTPVTIQGGKKCWFRVVARQLVQPDWSMASGIGGDAHYFRYSTGTTKYDKPPHDLAFSLDADWVNLGSGLTGVNGIPSLTASGPLVGGSTTTLNLASAAVSAPAWIVAGSLELNLPLAGGLLVPSPDIVVGTSTDAAGGLLLPFTMPAGTPPGLDFTVQVWLLDATGPAGLSASNALRSTTL